MTTTKKSAFGGSIDIASRQTGSVDALKGLGMAGPAAEIAELGKTRLGGKVEKPPPLKTMPAHEYTTSGTLENPKVASVKVAAEVDAPNYGKASSEPTSCKSCKAYDEQDTVMGHCSKYDFYCNAKYSCDAWASAKGRAPSQFIRLKVR